MVSRDNEIECLFVLNQSIEAFISIQVRNKNFIHDITRIHLRRWGRRIIATTTRKQGETTKAHHKTSASAKGSRRRDYTNPSNDCDAFFEYFIADFLTSIEIRLWWPGLGRPRGWK